mgnify:CR=1 FL=1
MDNFGLDTSNFNTPQFVSQGLEYKVSWAYVLGFVALFVILLLSSSSSAFLLRNKICDLVSSKDDDDKKADEKSA